MAAEQGKQGKELVEAAAKGSLTVVSALIQAKASVNHIDEDGWTALAKASRGGHEDCIRYLIDHGADKTIKCVCRTQRSCHISRAPPLTYLD